MRAPTPGGTRRRTRLKGEKGYILVVTTMLLVPLVVFTAFGVDLGSWYAEGVKEQRAVDAASLAGVVQLPSKSNAGAAAQAALVANGYNVTCTQSTSAASSSSPCTYTFPTSVSHQMTVSLWASAQRYFSQLVIKGESLQRSATAQYDTHIPLGTPSDTFGNDPSLPSGTAQPNVYGAISGPYNYFNDGDPFSTHCSGQSAGATSCSGGANSLYTGTGYEWAVQVPSSMVGKKVTVSVYDAGFNSGDAEGDGFGGNNYTGTSLTTSYTMYQATGSDADLNTSATNALKAIGGVCGTSPAGTSTNGTLTVGTGDKEVWTDLCSFTVPSMTGSQNLYPIIVSNGTSGTGSNSYSLRACVISSAETCTTSVTANPTVYAIDTMGIYTPDNGSGTSSSNFYLASITSQYAGHTLVVDMFDPGDANCKGSGSCSATISILQPPSGSPTNPPSSKPTVTGNQVPCTYTSAGAATGTTENGPQDTTSSPVCSIPTMSNGTHAYDGKWLTINITIPTTYSCTTDCWWTVYYAFVNATSTDRTTWAVDVLGNPVHLIH